MCVGGEIQNILPFWEAYCTYKKFVSLSVLPKIKGLGAICKISLGTQDVVKWAILGMNVHYHTHYHVNISPTISISVG